MKTITIKSSVLSVAMFTVISAGPTAHAGVFDQLASAANSALPAYGRVQPQAGARVDLEEGQIQAGILEAVDVGSDRVVGKVGNGYLDEAELVLSPDMRRARKKAIKAGFEEQFDLLQAQINQTIAAAVPATAELLKAECRNVEMAAPHSLLASHPTAVTDFLRQNLSASLQLQLQPVVDELMASMGAATTNSLLAASVEFGNPLDTVVRDYVVQQSIDGFFSQLEMEEYAIRQDPESRTTGLLKRVFG